VGTGGEEVAQPLGRVGDRVRSRDTDRVEALRAGVFGERRLERGWRGRCQKSRLA
jgi:hypothetical protein